MEMHKIPNSLAPTEPISSIENNIKKNEGIDGMTSHTQDVQPTRQLRAFVQRLGQQLDCPIAQHKVDETTAELLPNQLRVIAPCCGAKNA